MSDFLVDSSTLMYNRQTTRKGVMIDPEDGATYVISLATSTHSRSYPMYTTYLLVYYTGGLMLIDLLSVQRSLETTLDRAGA